MADPDNTDGFTPPAEAPRPLPEAFKARIWKPGQSGNPGGRPKSLARKIREMIGEDGGELPRWYNEVRLGNLQGFGGRERLEAAKWLSDHGWGPARSAERLAEELEAEDRRPAQRLDSSSLERMARRLAPPSDPSSENP